MSTSSKTPNLISFTTFAFQNKELGKGNIFLTTSVILQHHNFEMALKAFD
jgi:hypothetical protein